MKRPLQGLEFTKASSKGQVVIPTRIRKLLKIHEGSVLAVAAEGNMIVLKKVESGLSAEDLKTLKLVEEAWKDVEKGRFSVREKEAFFEELKRW